MLFGSMVQQHSSSSIYEQQEYVSEHHAPFKRSSWPATAVLERPAPPPPFLAWFDRKLLAAVLAIMLLSLVFTATDYGLHPAPLSSSAHLSAPSSTSYDSIAVHSTVLDVDLTAEVLLLEVKVQQQGAAVHAACRRPDAGQYEVAVGTAEPAGAAPAAVLPLCNSSSIPRLTTAAAAATPADASSAVDGQWQVYTVPIPLCHLNMLASPWEEVVADVKFTLRCSGVPCSAQHTPGVTWTAVWANSKMRVQLEWRLGLSELMQLDAADMYPIDEYSIAYMEALGLHRPSAEASFGVQMTRHVGVRVLQLLVALTQLCFVIYCLMMGVGQVLWAYVVHRFLCMRVHGSSRRTL